ncbi:MAG: hypothetical protein ACK4YP_16455, partial [Myxococcota bacterium]
ADIAIDADGRVFAASGNAIFRVDAASGDCTLETRVNDTGTGLTVLPDGRLLVAGASLTAWDLATGSAEVIVPAGGFATSGDVVAVPDGTVHWSVLGGSSDQWVVVDPATGTVTPRGPTGASGLWGVAYAEGALLAFGSGGAVFQVDSDSGHGTLVATTAIPFYGATTNPVTW